MEVKQRKDDLLIVRIEKQLKEEFTNINKTKNRKNSTTIRRWIQEFVGKHKN